MACEFERYTRYEPTPVTYSRTTAPSGRSFTVDGTSHAPNTTTIDLDYPMHGRVLVKSGGRYYDLDALKQALKLVDMAKEVG